MVSPVHAGKFFASLDQRKTMELKSYNLRCVMPGGSFHIAQTGCGTNKHGQNYVKLLGTLQFLGNTNVPQSELFTPENAEKHRASKTEVQTVQNGWTRELDGAIGWQVNMVSEFSPALYVGITHEELMPFKSKSITSRMLWDDWDFDFLRLLSAFGVL